jgi:hypothetical protein
MSRGKKNIYGGMIDEAQFLVCPQIALLLFAGPDS